MFRWKTPVLTGQWRSSKISAFTDALRAGQAEMLDSEIVLFEFVQIEQKGRTDCNLPDRVRLAV